jgi:hypothetical protein
MRPGVLGAVAVALVAGGCGQTDYATQVTSTGAHLNATITTLNDQAPTAGWFEYWPTSAPSSSHATTHRNVTSTGPFSEGIGGLANHTEYQYRFCGSEGGSDPVCAQTHRFTTGRTTVQAYGETQHSDPNAPSVSYYSDLDFDLVEDPGGVSGPAFVIAHYAGSFGQLQFSLGSHTAPEITCVNVDENVAVVGLHNTSGTISLQSFVQLTDGGPLGSGQDMVSVFLSDVGGNPHREPTDCSPLSGGLPLQSGEIVINDTP